MADKVVLTETPLIEEIREKTFDQILREQSAERQQDPTTPLEPEETEEEKQKKLDDEKAAQEAKDKEELENSRKHDEEVAQKAAQEVVDRQKAEEKAKEDKIRAEEEERIRQENLKPRFTGKDQNGNVVPLSYEELNSENVRIAKEEAKREVLAEIDARERAKQEEQNKITQTQEQQKTQQKAIEDQLQSELDRDLKSIYAAGDMPKIGDPKNANDPGNKEFNNLFETAQRVNAERIEKQLAPIRSIQVIRYGRDENGKPFYKPLENLAGSDAPVMGSIPSLSNEAPDDKYVPSRDRNKSWAQIAKEESLRLGKMLNVRGK